MNPLIIGMFLIGSLGYVCGTNPDIRIPGVLMAILAVMFSMIGEVSA